MTKLKNPEKADLNKDGKVDSYEENRGMTIEKSMRKQNRVKLKNGGFIAKGCGAVMNDKRKVTTISQEYYMKGSKKLRHQLNSKPAKKAPAKKKPVKKGKK